MRSYLLTKNRMAVKLNHRRIGANESRVFAIGYRSLRQQRKFLLDNLTELYTDFTWQIEKEYNYLTQPTENIYGGEKQWQTDVSSEPLDGFWREMWVYEMIDKIKPQIRKTTDKWYKKRYRLWREQMEINGFIFDDQIAIDYMQTFGELNLSNFKWSISKTTKLDVVKVLKEWLDNNWSISQVRDGIMKLDNTLFSKARSEMIAITEVGKAYEHWNFVPAKQLQSVGKIVQKKWQTVQDSRVRETHMQNENEWWVDLDYIYPATNTTLPPTGVRCRCTTLYKTT